MHSWALYHLGDPISIFVIEKLNTKFCVNTSSLYSDYIDVAPHLELMYDTHTNARTVNEVYIM